MSQVELSERFRIGLIRFKSAVTRAPVIVNERPPFSPEDSVEELHFRNGKFISIVFDGEGLPIRISESPTNRETP